MDVHLVDGTYELFRHFFAVPSELDRNGNEVGAVRGVLSSVLAMFEGGATHVGVATDHVVESFRNDLYPGYKTGEGVPEPLMAQFPALEEALVSMGVMVWPMIQFEADDALASAAAKASKDQRVTRVLICTPDKDLASAWFSWTAGAESCATKPASSRSGACGRNRFPIIWPWSATAPMVFRASRAGVRKRPL